MFLNVCMLSSFGMMIIARQQMLLWDDSVLKMHTFVRYGMASIRRCITSSCPAVYALVNIVLHLWTAVTVLAIPSDRRRQIESLAGVNTKNDWNRRNVFASVLPINVA